MKMKRLLSISIAAGISLAAVGFTNSSAAGNNNGNPPSWSAAAEKNCPPANKDEASCNSWTLHTFINGKEVQDAKDFANQIKALGKPQAISAPSGFSPQTLQSIYGVIQPASNAPTIAIVDVYNSYVLSGVQSDLSNYRKNFYSGSSNFGALKIYNQSGALYTGSSSAFSGYTSARGWDGEIALDVQMVTAICPTCNINLYLAKTPSYSNLNAAVTAASSSTVTPAAISNSYGGSDVAGTLYSAYTTANANGIAVTASTGDNGYGVQSPASFTGVIAVGGTSLRNVGTNSWTESAWSGAGSGCSSISANQRLDQFSTLNSQYPKFVCNNKVNADISAVADPNTGVSIYLNGYWKIYGGTSASSPIIATYIALQNWKSATVNTPFQYVWSRNWSDVTSGSNGSCGAPLCTSASGWDGPTGLGTPRVL